MRALHRLGQPGARRFLHGQQPGPLQLQGEPGQRVREHVVHVPGQPLPLGQGRRAHLGVLGLLQVDQQPLDLVTVPVEPPGEQGAHDDDAGQDGDQHVGDAHARPPG